MGVVEATHVDEARLAQWRQYLFANKERVAAAYASIGNAPGVRYTGVISNLEVEVAVCIANYTNEPVSWSKAVQVTPSVYAEFSVLVGSNI